MSSKAKLVRVLEGSPEKVPPVWLMRQAGRYLPEYRKLRAEAGSFWAMALTPHYAAEVTLQPIRRFGFDAAILFSDILTVPEALGQKVTFTEGEGPSLTPVSSAKGFHQDHEAWAKYFEPVYEALRLTRAGLGDETALLGFAGAPWTLATYLAAGAGGDEQKAAKLWAYRDPEGFGQLLDILSDCVAFHLIRQLEAGYIGQVYHALLHYADFIRERETILVGDFNSNAIWDHERAFSNHSAVVRLLDAAGMVSVYHAYFDEAPGREQQPTFYWHRNAHKGYHLDYCFVPKPWLARLNTVTVGPYAPWCEHSDHTPMLIEFA